MARTREEAINSYITDMLALEDHIEKAIAAQVEDYEKEYPQLGSELDGMRQKIERHIRDLRALATTRGDTGGSIAEAVKRAASVVAGLGAAAIDLVRTEKLPKNLRDDYTAFSLANVGYQMLFTTAKSLGDTEVAIIAERHLSEYATMIMTLGNIIPETVIKLLQSEGLPADANAIPDVVRSIRAVWANS